jgi:hypothetical protein
LRRIEQTRGFVPMDWQPGGSAAGADVPRITAEA